MFENLYSPYKWQQIIIIIPVIITTIVVVTNNFDKDLTC